MAEQQVAQQTAGAGATAAPSIYERIGEQGLKRAVRAATPLWTRLTRKGPIAERVLRDILGQARSINDVDRLYRDRHWRRTDYKNRPRRHKVIPVLRRLGVPER